MTERRFTSRGKVTIQTREDKSRVIVGYAAVFHRAADPGTQYELWEGVVERVAPQAFDRALRERDDARGAFNHDPNFILGRVSAGTMRLSVDSVGLRYEIDLPDTQAGRDTATSIERGDITGSSFAFIPRQTRWISGSEGEPEVRMLEDVELYDCGPVTYPAYESTTTGVRSSGDVEEVRVSHGEWKAKRGKEKDAACARARILEIELENSYVIADR